MSIRIVPIVSKRSHGFCFTDFDEFFSLFLSSVRISIGFLSIGTCYWHKYVIGASSRLFVQFSVFVEQNGWQQQQKWNNTRTHNSLSFSRSHSHSHSRFAPCHIVCTRKRTNHNAMRHFLFGILFGFTHSLPISSIPLVLLTLSSRCVHDDDVEIIK